MVFATSKANDGAHCWFNLNAGNVNFLSFKNSHVFCTQYF